MMPDFPITDRTRMRRKASRATYDRDTIYTIIDEALTASVAAVIDGRPQAQPMIHVRIGDDIILHGLGGNRLLSTIAAGGEACINLQCSQRLRETRTTNGQQAETDRRSSLRRGAIRPPPGRRR